MTAPVPAGPAVVDDALVARAAALVGSDRRALLGIAGAPASGKSTLAAALVDALEGRGVRARLVPMDGFHLADTALEHLGRRDRKGAPDTFDAAGYAALLQRLRTEVDGTVYAPSFERELEQPLAGSIAVGPDVELVVTEGNYLLLDQPPWTALRRLLDEVWFCRLDEEERRRRLLRRHVRFGKSEAEARAWEERVDRPNAALVATTADAADLVIDLPTTAPSDDATTGGGARRSGTPAGRPDETRHPTSGST